MPPSSAGNGSIVLGLPGVLLTKIAVSLLSSADLTIYAAVPVCLLNDPSVTHTAVPCCSP